MKLEVKPGARLIAVTTVIALAVGAGAAGAADPATTVEDRMASPAAHGTLGDVARVFPGCDVILGGHGSASETGQASQSLPCGGRDTVGSGGVSTPCVVPLVDDRCEAWIGPRYDAGEYDGAGAGLGTSRSVASSPDGSAAYTLASSDGAAGGERHIGMVLVAQDATSGATRWSSRTDFAGEDLWGISTVADPGGDLVYALGTALGVAPDPPVAVIVAFDADTGARRWLVRDGTGLARAIDVDPAGERLYVVGRQLDAQENRSFLVTSFDADTGAVVWRGSYSGDFPAGASASALTLSPGGDMLYVAGTGASSSPTLVYKNIAWPIVAYDVAASEEEGRGEISWVEQWDAPEPQSSFPMNPPAAIAATPDGSRLFVVGGAEGQTLFDIFTVSFDATSGEKLWESSYEGPRAQIKSSFDSVWWHGPLAVSGDGGEVFVAGYSTCMHGVNICMEFVTLSYDAATGAQRWATRYGSEEWLHWFPSVAADPEGDEVFVSGQARHFTLISGRYATLSYDADDGTQNWVARHTDGFSDWNGMAMSPDGKRLFVTGSTVDGDKDAYNADDYDMLTISYSM